MSNSTLPSTPPSTSTLFPAAPNFAPPRDDRSQSPLHADKTPAIICLILLGMIVTAVGAWAVYSYRRKRRDLETLDEESASGGTSKTFDNDEKV